MGESVKVLEYKGKRILFGDYSNMKQEDFIKGIEELGSVSAQSREKKLLHLLNFTDSVMSSAVRDKADGMVTALQNRGYTIRTACFGVRGLQRVIANAVKKDMYFAKDESQAKEWRVQAG
jgi:hypothetical protein